jgi:hypothetical protein
MVYAVQMPSCGMIYRVYVNDALLGIKYKETTKQYQRKIKFSEISKLAVYLHITYVYRQAPQFSEMTSPTETNFCATEFAKSSSCTSVQLCFRKRFRKDPPPRASMQRWSDNCENQGCICKKETSGRPRVSDEATFNRSVRKSVRKGSCELQMPKTTLWQVLRRRVRMKPYNATLTNRWIGRAGAAVEECMKWSPRSPDLTPCDFFLWGYVKEQVFVPPLQLKWQFLQLSRQLTGTCQKEYGMSWITDWTFVGSRMELTLSIFRVCKTIRVCHSNDTSYNCIVLIFTLV